MPFRGRISGSTTEVPNGSAPNTKELRVRRGSSEHFTRVARFGSLNNRPSDPIKLTRDSWVSMRILLTSISSSRIRMMPTPRELSRTRRYKCCRLFFGSTRRANRRLCLLRVVFPEGDRYAPERNQWRQWLCLLDSLFLCQRPTANERLQLYTNSTKRRRG